MGQAVVLFYESAVEEKWQIVRLIRAQFLATGDEMGRPRFPPDEYVFPCAHTPEDLGDILRGLAERGESPEILVVNLYELSPACVPLIERCIKGAHVLLLWRGRDGDLDGVTDASRELRRLVMEKTGGAGLSLQYGPADREEKAHAAARAVASELRAISAELAGR